MTTLQDGTAAPSVHDKTRLHFLDALRGLAACYVVIYHMALMPQPNLVLPRWAEKFTLMGGTGVTLFFIVSAFSLYYTMPLRASSSRPIASFFIHRVFRIAPLFYLMIVLSLLRDAWLFGAHHPPGEIAAAALFVFNFVPMQQESFVWAGWTIGVEMVFYAIFPLIYARVQEPARAVALFFLFLLAWVAFRTVLAYLVLPAGWVESYLQWSALKHFPIFATGVILYFWFVGRSPDSFALASSRARGDAALLAGAFGYVALVQGWLPNVFGDPYYWQAVCYGLIFVGLALSPWKALVNRVTSFLGKVSYSLYLFHPTVVYLMIPVYRRLYAYFDVLSVAFLASAAITFAVLLPLSYAGYRLIELPGIKLGKRIERRFIPLKETP